MASRLARGAEDGDSPLCGGGAANAALLKTISDVIGVYDSAKFYQNKRWS